LCRILHRFKKNLQRKQVIFVHHERFVSNLSIEYHTPYLFVTREARFCKVLSLTLLNERVANCVYSYNIYTNTLETKETKSNKVRIRSE